MPDTSGRLFEMPWACFVHGSWYSRTCGATCPSDSERFSGTWPTSGSMRDGACYEHPTWGHPTSAPDCSLLPTATASDWKGPNRSGSGSASANGMATVAERIALLPTPRSNEANGTGDHGTGGPDLRTLVDSLLPTPTVQASKHAVPTPYERERYKAGGLDAYNLWVVIPMLFDGDPTDPPSPDGKPSTDQHQPPLPTGD